MAKSFFTFPGIKAQFKSLKMNLILTIPIIMAISTMLKSELLVPFQTPNLWVQISFSLAKWN